MIDWTKPLRTKRNHFKVERIGHYWEKPAYHAVRVVDTGLVWLSQNDGLSVFPDGPEIENEPDQGPGLGPGRLAEAREATRKETTTTQQSREYLIATMTQLFQDCLNLVQAKNHDYSQDSDCFHNFRLAEFLGVAPTEAAILTRLLDKVSRVARFDKGSYKVQDEKLRDTIMDLINYAAILYAFVGGKEPKQ